jgi:hypothetical protein
LLQEINKSTGSSKRKMVVENRIEGANLVVLDQKSRQNFKTPKTTR